MCDVLSELCFNFTMFLVAETSHRVGNLTLSDDIFYEAVGWIHLTMKQLALSRQVLLSSIQ